MTSGAAESRSDTPAKRILYAPSDRGACVWYRCLTPGTALTDAGHSVRVEWVLEQDVVDACDVLVAQRSSHPDIVSVFEYAQSRGTRTVYDIDDDLWNVSPQNPAHYHWHQETPQRVLNALVRAADVVTTTTPALAERIRTFNKNVVVIPNMLPEKYWPASRKVLVHENPLVIGWAGSRTHEEDFAVVSGALAEILRRYPDVELHLAGASEDWLEPHERIRHLPPVPIGQYANLIADFDIALAPLKVSRFNHCKSDLKVLEYSMIGLPVVATKVDSYKSFIRHGQNGMLANSAKDWLTSISRLIEEPGLRESLAENARASAERRLMRDHVRLYEKAYGLSPREAAAPRS